MTTLPDGIALFIRGALLVVCVGAVAVYTASAALRRGEGAAGAGVRLIATLVGPATMLAFAHVFVWPLALGAAVIIALWQSRAGVELLVRRVREIWRSTSAPTRIAVFVLAAVVVIRCGLVVSSPPNDGDGLLYHLPVTAALIQEHGMWFTRAALYPGAAELLGALGGAVVGNVNGVLIMEFAQVLAFLLAAYAWARRAGAGVDASVATAVVAGAMPIVIDQMISPENDLIVCALLAGACVLWRQAPRLAAIAFGLVLATKVTAFILVPVVVMVMSFCEGWPFSIADVAWILIFALPWSLRTVLLTGTPIYTTASLGWNSTIAKNFMACWWWTLTAIRNYGGLAAVGGGVALLFRLRPRDKPAFARVVAWLAVASYLAWIVMPNGAESVPGALDQVHSGWSIRYALILVFILATALPIVLGSISKLPLAGITALLLAIAGFARADSLAVLRNPQTLPFVLLFAVAFGLIALVTISQKAISRVALIGAIVVLSWSTFNGALAISHDWSPYYVQWFSRIPGSRIIADTHLASYARVAVLGIRSFPLAGPRFERRVYEHVLKSSPQEWVTTLRSERVPILIASNNTGSPLDPSYLQPLPEEAPLARTAGVCLVKSDGVLRVYALNVATNSERCTEAWPRD